LLPPIHNRHRLLAVLALATAVRLMGWIAGDGDFWLWPALYTVATITLVLVPISAHRHLDRSLRGGRTERPHLGWDASIDRSL
jgi:hypothetical protein